MSLGEVALDEPGVATLDRRLLALMTVACGATVANLYYPQPLLPAISRAFQMSQGAAGLLVTVMQVSYALGMLFIVPLGDLVDRRRLVFRLLLLGALGLAASAAAGGFAALAAPLAVVAATCVVAPLLIPFGSTLAPEHERGRVVGTIVGGVLTGILVARTFAGLVAGAIGWRGPFAIAAGAMLVLAVALRRALPQVAPPATVPYRSLLLSVATLVRREPLLRRRMAFGSFSFASFSLVWTTLGFLLADAPFHLSQGAIGLFGLAGVVGAACAQPIGRIGDRGHSRAATGASLAGILLAWGILALGSASLALIVAGLVVLDFGMQAQNVLNQGAVYALGRERASRLATAYLTANFVGGALGSSAAALAWSVGGWDAVCAVGAAFATVALAAWATDRTDVAVSPARSARLRGTRRRRAG